MSEKESTEGHTPLHLAVLYGNRGIIQALVDKGM
nr:ankyrin repeat domain-containing protein [Wolbachia endosymbiont of Brugia pahangi]